MKERGKRREVSQPKLIDGNDTSCIVRLLYDEVASSSFCKTILAFSLFPLPQKEAVFGPALAPHGAAMFQLLIVNVVAKSALDFYRSFTSQNLH